MLQVRIPFDIHGLFLFRLEWIKIHVVMLPTASVHRKLNKIKYSKAWHTSGIKDVLRGNADQVHKD